MRTKNSVHAVVMFSGGIDSTVSLYWAIRRQGFKIFPVTFDYFRRSSMESKASDLLVKLLHLRPIRIKLPFMKEISDLKRMNKNPELNNAPSAYVPGRNTIIYGIASSYAEILDCKYIIGGHNREDTRSYPDSSPNFFSLFNEANSIGLYSKRRTSKVILPLSKLSKAEVVKLGIELKVPFELTWSCYFQGRRPCGRCEACRLRTDAFEKLGEKDPLLVRAKP